jgi:hypothetical protein
MNSKTTDTTSENMNGNGDSRLNITAASEYLGTSRNTTWRVIKRNKIKTYVNVLDMRETLVLRKDLDRLKNQLRPKMKSAKEPR